MLSSAITLRGLKRYASELLQLIKDNHIVLNPIINNPESTLFNIYIFFSIGYPDNNIKNMRDTECYIKNKFTKSGYLTKENANKLNQKMLSTPEYAQYIKKGMDSVLDWDYQ